MQTRATFRSPVATPWICRNCNGDQMCLECRKVVQLRAVAVRLLSCPESPHFDELLVGTDRHSGARRAEALQLIDDFAERLRSGEVPIPEVLPVRVRHDDERRIKLAHSIYRALGDGSRRRVRSEFGA